MTRNNRYTTCSEEENKEKHPVTQIGGVWYRVTYRCRVFVIESVTFMQDVFPVTFVEGKSEQGRLKNVPFNGDTPVTGYKLLP